LPLRTFKNQLLLIMDFTPVSFSTTETDTGKVANHTKSWIFICLKNSPFEDKRKLQKKCNIFTVK
jgi:hypothetical protein